MNSKSTNLLWLFMAFLSFIKVFGQAQLPVGSWRVHLPYATIGLVERAGNKIYAGVGAGMLVYDHASGEVQTLSKIDGLNDVGVTAMAFHSPSNTLIVGYESGNIDFITGNRTRNLNAIVRADFFGSKRINHIHIDRNLAYLSCDFGLVVINISRNEIRESNVTLGLNGGSVKLFSATVMNDTLFAASTEGIKRVPLKANLLDNANWKTLIPEALYGLPANSRTRLNGIQSLNGRLYVSLSDSGIFFREQDGSFKVQQSVPKMAYRIMKADLNKLILFASDSVLVLNQNNEIERLIYKQGKFDLLNGATFSGDGSVLYFGDQFNGFVKTDYASGIANNIVLNGPFSANMFKLYSYEDKVAVLSGGINIAAAYLQRNLFDGFYEFQNGFWTNYNSFYGNAPAFSDPINAEYQESTGSLFISTYGYGLIERKKDLSYVIHDDKEPGSTLCNEIPGESFTRILGSATDLKGVQWILNGNARCNNLSLHARYPDNTWQGYRIGFIPDYFQPWLILIDNTNRIWMTTGPGRVSGNNSILVMNDEGQLVKPLGTSENSGGLPDGNVFAMVKDKKGQIWVGTGKGVAVFFNPEAVQQGVEAKAYLPIYDGRPVLENYKVSSIAIDGGNRKWIGTDGAGAWLFNEDMSRAILHLTTANSPLLSDQITDIAINKATGEVFFATDKGLISYQSDGGSENIQPGKEEECLSDISIFPNPVKPGYDGLITIKGVSPNSVVKITDMAGRLMYENNAIGNMLAWNQRDYAGRKAQPGVYLVFSSQLDGTQACVTKLAIVR